MATNLQAEARAELELRRCRKSVEHFISRWVWIEDKASPDKVSPFQLWPEQVATLRILLVRRFIIALKARQLGFTWLVLAYAVWRMLFVPGYTVVAVSKTDDDAIELVDYRLAQILLPRLPRWLIRRKSDAPKWWAGPVWEATKHEIVIYHLGNVVSRFRADAGPDAGRSLTADLVILDEWAANPFAETIWEAAYPTINRPGSTPTDGQVIIISTNQRATLFEQQVIAARKGESGFHLIFWPWTADPRRTEEWYEATKKALPNSYRQEYPATIDDALSAGEATAFPEFDSSVGGLHVCRPFKIPKWWRRWMSNDPGFSDPFAWYWFAADQDGTVYIYREFTREPQDLKLTYSDQARRVHALSVVGGEVGNPEIDPVTKLSVEETIDFVVCGRDAFNKHPETGKSITDYYQEGGVIGCIEATTDRQLRAAVFHEYLRVFTGPDGKPTARLKIFSTCRKLIETLPRLVSDPNDPEKVQECSIDHWFDACGYGLLAWHAERSVNKVREPDRPGWVRAWPTPEEDEELERARNWD